MRILVIASLADSLLNFRGALLEAMADRGLDVHGAATAELAQAKVEWETAPAQWQTRKRAARERIVQNFSVEKMAASYAAIWQE